MLSKDSNQSIEQKSSQDNPINIILEAALDYASKGFPVFPCVPHKKSPYLKTGFKEASTDKASIESWWTQWPDAWIGVPTGKVSGFVVLDIDIKNGRKGRESLDKLLNGTSLPRTKTVKTVSGGEHYYFSAGSQNTKNFKGKNGSAFDGIDVRGDGGYVIVPPSPGYEDTVDMALNRLPLAPEWLSKLKSLAAGGASKESVKGGKLGPNVGVGERDETFFLHARKLAEAGMTEAEAVGALTVTLKQYTEENPDDPFTLADVRKKVKSAYRNEYRKGERAVVGDRPVEPVTYKLETAKDRDIRWFKKPPEPPTVLVPGVLQNDVMLFNAAGGGTKTTLSLWTQIRVLLGLPIYEREPTREGACLYLTAEDKQSRLDYRIHKLCAGMELSKKQERHVAKNLYIENWRGLNRRFVESDLSGNLINTGWCEYIMEKYGKAGLVMMVIDPLIQFSPGERFGNDGAAALMGRIGLMGEELGNINVLCCHHTGQDAYRKKSEDQYVGRGASANADQSRGVLSANYCSEPKDFESAPPEITKAERAHGLVIRINAGKLSDEARSQAPLWAVRGFGDSWTFRTYRSADPGLQEEVNKAAARDELKFNLDKVIRVIGEQNQRGRANKKSIEAVAGVIGLTRTQVRDAIAYGEGCGYIHQEPLPKEEIQGNNKHYWVVLKVSEKPTRKEV